MEEQLVVALNYDVGQTKQLYRWAGKERKIILIYMYNIIKKFEMKYGTD